MMPRSLIFPILLCLLCLLCNGCEASDGTRSSQTEALSDGTRLRVQQRSSQPLPGSQGRLLLNVDDISGGRTQVTLRSHEGAMLAGPSVLAEGDALSFSLGGRPWRLRLDHMHNELIGNDWAEFVLSDAASGGDASTVDDRIDPRAEIEALIEAIAALEGATFIRNGKAHPAPEAADHLRLKWRNAGNRIRSAEDFIQALASASSISGLPYRIRLADGTETGSREWLQARLAELRGKAR